MKESRPSSPGQAGEMDQAIDSALLFLSGLQRPDGEFRTFLFREPHCRLFGFPDSTPFSTASVVHSLSLLKTPTASAMCRQGLQFLRSSMLPGGLWNYWTRRSGKSIVPDLDDTCCASRLVLDAGDSSFPAMNSQTICRQRDAQGRFFTWFEKNPQTNDIDSVVNANVLWYLGDCEETRRANEWLCTLIETHSERDSYWYYVDDLALYYAISRAAEKSAPSLLRVRDQVCIRIKDRANGAEDLEPHAAALALASLAAFGRNEPVALEGLARRIMAAQQPEGGWKASAYYAGPEPPEPHRVWFGAESVSTALCIEALCRYRALRSKTTN